MQNLILFFALLISPLIFAEQSLIIGIAGGTGSGKTRLAKEIQEAFGPHATIIEQDCYYKDLSHLSEDERAKINFDHPNSLDFSLLHRHLIDLKNKKPISKPVYDFKTHSRTAEAFAISPTNIILVEGILLFCVPEIRDLFDLKIYVEAEDDIRILRRLERDTCERGRDFNSVKEQYLTTVKPMHNQFVQPSKIYADIIVPSWRDTSEAKRLVISWLKEMQP